MPLYEIVVRTGAVPAGGTNADVYVRLHGEFGSTSWIELDNPSENFEQGFEDVFYVGSAEDIGKLRELDIRHTNTGPKPGWFLEWVKVRNWQAKLEWHFPHNRWLAVDEGDRQLMHTLKPTSSSGTAIEPAPIGVPPEGAGFEIPTTDVLDASTALPDTAERIAVASREPNRLDVLARGMDGAIWRRNWNSGWSGWSSLGGSFTSGPAAASWAPQRFDVVGRGLDHALWHRAWSNGTWNDWSSLGGQLTSDPDICSWAPNRLDVFVRGDDGALWHLVWENGWSAWESLGGVLASSPGAVSWGSGHIAVVARGLDDSIWHLSYYQNAWGTWESLGSP